MQQSRRARHNVQGPGNDGSKSSAIIGCPQQHRSIDRVCCPGQRNEICLVGCLPLPLIGGQGWMIHSNFKGSEISNTSVVRTGLLYNGKRKWSEFATHTK